MQFSIICSGTPHKKAQFDYTSDKNGPPRYAIRLHYYSMRVRLLEATHDKNRLDFQGYDFQIIC